jgi:hypothetical protein
LLTLLFRALGRRSSYYGKIPLFCKVDNTKRGVDEEKSADFPDFFTLWGHINPYINRGSLLNEEAVGHSTRAEMTLAPS